MTRVIVRVCAAALALMMISAASAQETAAGARAWIPADAAGFVAVPLDAPGETLDSLNIAGFVASVLQPTRLNISAATSLNAWLPLDFLDLESASFDALILPWAQGELVIAYPTLDDGYVSAQPLLIVPTADSFAAAAQLAPALQGQDFLRRESQPGALIYDGDRVSVAFTAGAVVIGARGDVEAALASGSGEAARLTDTPEYQRIAQALDAGAALTAYVQGEAASRALPFVVSRAGGGALLQAFGEALAVAGGSERDAALASGAIEAAGVAVLPASPISDFLEASAVVLLSEPLSLPAGADDADALLRYLPRSAIVAQRGDDAGEAARTLLTAAPLTNYAGLALGAFPFVTPPIVANGVLDAPAAADIEAAAAAALSALGAASGLDIEQDVLRALDGPYVAALLPRPNNPIPVLSSEVELLGIIATDDAQAALGQVRALAGAVLGAEALQDDPVDGQPALRVIDTVTGAVLASAIAAPDALLIGTGAAAETALRAGQGDNRLTDQPRWQALAQDTPPQWYFDIDGIYNIIAPSAGGRADGGLKQAALWLAQPEHDLLRFTLRAALGL